MPSLPIQEPRPAKDIPILTSDELRRIDAYWRASNYLCAGMIYLRENALLRKPLRPEHFKNRLLGHWGTDPGQTFTWVHLNRVIRKYDLDMMYVCGPGHGAPAVLSNTYLEGTYSEIYPEKSQNEALFMRADQVEQSWRVVTPILDEWATKLPADFPNYASGSWGPSAADELLRRDGRKWRAIETSDGPSKIQEGT